MQEWSKVLAAAAQTAADANCIGLTQGTWSRSSSAYVGEYLQLWVSTSLGFLSIKLMMEEEFLGLVSRHQAIVSSEDIFQTFQSSDGSRLYAVIAIL